MARLPIAVLVAALVVSGCGGGSGSGGDPTVAIALDFTPNAVHAPIYAAVLSRFDRAERVHLRIRPPGARPDSLKLVTNGRADLAVLDIHDLAIARERGVDVVAVGALVQRPLGALVTQPAIRRPRDLDGKRIGVSGLPSDPAFVRAIVEHDGGNYDSVREITIGFNAVASLLGKKVDAVPVFWNAEGVILKERGAHMNEFRVEDYGAPPYPEVVLVTTRANLDRRRDAIVRAIAAIKRGAEASLRDPEPVTREIARASGGTDLALVRAQMRAVAPIVAPPLRLDRSVIDRWADFDARIGIVRRRPDVGRAFDFTVVR
ncbi:MAG: putative hydroxymethylpyrimidine transport system substrate-binding protein [Thermoleophilales bacterium]|nr:putative hydroxymethylpyrimidine transport system substrate-binding protein [Thermoleophilales bacterium]